MSTTAQHPSSALGPIVFAYDGSELAKLAIDEAAQQLAHGRAALALAALGPDHPPPRRPRRDNRESRLTSVIAVVQAWQLIFWGSARPVAGGQSATSRRLKTSSAAAIGGSANAAETQTARTMRAPPAGV